MKTSQLFIAFSPIIAANWEADSGNQWAVPLGAGIGQIMRWGKQPVHVADLVYAGEVTGKRNENGRKESGGQRPARICARINRSLRPPPGVSRTLYNRILVAMERDNV